jgi:hypothetical protein
VGSYSKAVTRMETPGLREDCRSLNLTAAPSDECEAAGGPPRWRASGRRAVGAQIAGSTVFLAIAALAAQSYGKIPVMNFGFDHDQLVAAEFDPVLMGMTPADPSVTPARC